MSTHIDVNRKYNLKRSSFIDNHVVPYILLLPSSVLILVFVLVPFLLNIIVSFTDYSLINPNYSFVGIQNYVEVFNSGILVVAVIKTAIWTIGCLIPSLIIGLIACLLMNSNIKFVNVLKAAILLPWVLPEVVTGYAWQWMFSGDFGIITHYLIKLHIIDDSFSFFTTTSAAMTAVIIANVWRSFPFIAVMLYAKLKTLPAEMVEAAKIDGAGSIQIFTHVTISWLMPIAARVMALAFIWTSNAFSIIFTMTAGGPAGGTETLSVLMQRIAMRDYNFPIATALGVIVFIITALCILLPFLSKKLTKKSYNDG